MLANKNTVMFFDPEANVQSRFNVYYDYYKRQFLKTYKNKYVALYLKLIVFIGFLSIIRNLIPEEYVLENELLVGTISPKYTSLSNITPFRSIISSPELRNKYSNKKSIMPVIYPQNGFLSTIESISFKKELNYLRSELKKTLQMEKLSCIPAISLGVTHNILFDKNEDFYLNVEFMNKSDIIVSEENGNRSYTTIKSQGVFDDHDQELTVYEEIDILYIDPKNFVQRTKRLTDLSSYCIQSYLKSFQFESIS